MDKNTRVSLFLITLSVLAFNTAFLFPALGFLIVWWGLFLLMPFVSVRTVTLALLLGFYYGLLIYGFHFSWLAKVLMHHSQASLALCCALYSGVVIYFSLTYALWAMATTMIVARCAQHQWVRWVLWVVSFVGYGAFIELWALYVVGLGSGYPFLNPLIPLVRYRWFLILVVWLSGGALSKSSCGIDNFTYIPPVVNRIKNIHAPWRACPEGVGQKIFYQFNNISHERRSRIFLSPESTFMFPLNDYKHIIALWDLAMPDKSHYLIGTLYKKEQRWYQAVFLLQKNLIMKIYVKKILTPFVEHMPPLWQHLQLMRSIFAPNDEPEFSATGDSSACVEYFDIDRARIIPRICFELFFTRRHEIVPLTIDHPRVVLIFFANDSWFCPLFKSILHRLVALKSATLGVPIIYVGHDTMTMHKAC